MNTFLLRDECCRWIHVCVRTGKNRTKKTQRLEPLETTLNYRLINVSLSKI